MTLESTACRNRYIGNGSAKEFPFAFKAWNKGQVAVYIGDGTTEQEVSASCSIELTATGGSVVFPFAPGSGTVVVIRRRMPFVQEDSYVNGTRFNPEEIEDRFDQDCAERQELKQSFARAVIAPETSEKDGAEICQDMLQATAAAIDAAGYARETAQWARDYIADLPSGDVSFANATAWGATQSRTVADRLSDIVNVRDFGAKGDGTTDDGQAFSAAITAASGKTLFVPAGSYKIGDPLFASGVAKVVDFGTYAYAKPVYPSTDMPIKDLRKFKKLSTFGGDRDGITSTQGLCYITSTNKFAVAAKNSADTYQEIYVLNGDTGEREAVHTYTTLYHANSLTYCTETNKIYSLVSATLNPDTGTVAVIDPSSFSVESTFTLTDGSLTALKYDSACKVFVALNLRSGTTQKYDVYDIDFNLLKSFTVYTPQETNNGFCCHDGIITQLSLYHLSFVSLLGNVIGRIEFTGATEPEDMDWISDGIFAMNSNPYYNLYLYDKNNYGANDNFDKIENTTKIQGTVDLNGFTTPGLYDVETPTSSQNNFPPSVVHGLLEVKRDRKVVFQTLYRVSAGMFAETYRRYLNLGTSNGWSAWIRVDNGATLVSHDIKWKGAGYITSSKTQICFTVPLCYNPKNRTISVTSASLDARQDGSYVVSGDITGAGFTISIVIEESGLKITVTSSSELTCTNNASCGIDFYAELSLS